MRKYLLGSSVLRGVWQAVLLSLSQRAPVFCQQWCLVVVVVVVVVVQRWWWCSGGGGGGAGVVLG
jgi:hypothetical protein